MTPADKKRAQTWRAWEQLINTPDFGEFLLDRQWDITSAYKTVPHDDGAEQALLGALVNGADEDWEERHPRVLARVLPCHFFRGENASIYIAVARVLQRVRQGKCAGVDVVEVGSELRRAGMLIQENESIYDRSGARRFVTAAFLTSLWDMCPSTVNVAAYADTVLECARLRALYELGFALQNAVTGEQAPQGQHDFSEMGGQPLGSDPAQLTNALRRAADAIEARGFADLKTIFGDLK